MLKCWNFQKKKIAFKGTLFFWGNIENIQKYYEIFKFSTKNFQNKIIIWHWNVELAMYLNGTYLVGRNASLRECKTNFSKKNISWWK